MRKAWKIFRAIAVVLLVMAVALPVSLYVLLSTGPVQQFVRKTACTELSKAIGADVQIDRVHIYPFNRVSLEGFRLILPETSDTVATISRVSAGVELRHLIRTGQLSVDYALLDGLSVNLWRNSDTTDLNIAPILRHIKRDRRSGRKSSISLRFNNVIVRNAAVNYTVLDAPEAVEGRFNPRRIAFTDVFLNAYIPQISSEGYKVQIEHLSARERSGFVLSRLRTQAMLSKLGATLNEFSIELPDSYFALRPMQLSYDGYADIPRALDETPLVVGTSARSTIYPPDLQAFVPQLGAIDRELALEFAIDVSDKRAKIDNFMLSDAALGTFALRLRGNAARTDAGYDYNLENAVLVVDGNELAALGASLIGNKERQLLDAIGTQAVHINASGNQSGGRGTLRTDGTAGTLNATGRYTLLANKNIALSGKATFTDLEAGLLANRPQLGIVSGNIDGTFTTGRKPHGNIKAHLSELLYKDYLYSDITLAADLKNSGQAEVRAAVNDPSALLNAYIFYTPTDTSKRIQATALLANVDFNALGLDSHREGMRFGAKVNADMDITDVNRPSGRVLVSDVRWLDDFNHGLNVKNIEIDADGSSTPCYIDISSDFLNGRIAGTFDFANLVPQIKAVAANFVPNLIPLSEPKNHVAANDFRFNLAVDPCESITSFFNLPVHILERAEIDGFFDSSKARASLAVDAPYLRQGDKLIEGSSVHAILDHAHDIAAIYLTTQFPTNKGDMALSGLISARNNTIDTRLDWEMIRKIPLNGSLSFTTTIGERYGSAEPKGLVPFPLTVQFNPGTINFGDDTWSMARSRIAVSNEHINIDNFGLSAGEQKIAINGTAGSSDSDSLTIGLNHIALLPIFETLEIDNALIGGRATGAFTARNVLSKEPALYCPHLHVDSIGYNRCTIGDADIEAHWDNTDRAFALDAAIVSPEGYNSHIFGKIFAFDEALDINFEASHVPVGFLKPFLGAFASDINGHATGKCRLFGTFKEIDLEGKVAAEDVKMKIDFTNTWYSATDTVVMTPGRIALDNIEIRDVEGHTARLNGVVEHTFFKEPVFDFDISHARNFLSFNATSKQYPDWYGTIYGNGGASISGYPGVVNIKVNMSTAPGSHFTFVLSDRLDAETYSFLTFRDVTPDTMKVVDPTNADHTPELVRQLRDRIRQQTADEPSAYNMDLRVDITKDATMTLVMDPMAGDEIKAVGDGNLRLAYQSVDNSLNIWGAYKVLSGSYRFTLQDVIIRDFTIKEGSEIRFDGNPYAVKTNLTAYYATTANLTDLDKSFAQDKDISRTNVPVHALMLVSGDVRQPTIDFDLEFPTLTSDTYRKVRSIVSTTDMMNRQIIYLLALNRFYTPDYMDATKGNELFSVASSTIASQLGNMLGKLSDNWSIAPNLRSDQGNFSDVEVDLALSSRLLNNRLLFNGNFGYRDKSLNTNQFVGDFDIEYLLNKRGSWRLKAYNRYNDRNFYVHSAQTTQGVGLVFRRDFDDILSFLKRLRRKSVTAPDSVPNDSIVKR